MPPGNTAAATTAAALTCLLLAGCGAGSSAATGAATSSARATSTITSTVSGTSSNPKPVPRPATTTGPRMGTPPVPRAAKSVSATRLPAPAGAQPRTRFPRNPAAVGPGANAIAVAVPGAIWARMVGYSWTRGCPVGRSSLRYLTVNFWGFDGRRSRGAIVVNARIASRTKTAFTRLYQQHFRIRQMRVMDRGWGHNPKGPGANDYAAMKADNTSGFNCRYVGGEESRKVWSNHAYGTAIDVNDFENPYVDRRGRVYPNAWFLTRRSPHTGVFSSLSSASVRAFTARGFRWGGAWHPPDFQHFDVPR